MHTLDLGDGRSIEYRMVLGDPSAGPTLVFLHEGLGSASLWRDFPDKVARRLGVPAVAYSRFGYGRSSPLAEPRTPRFMHEEALDILPVLLDRLAIEAPILIGHSDGASIALIHAADSGRPVSGVVLIAPHVFVEDVTVRSIARAVEAYEKRGLRERLARHHADVDGAFLGWSRIWLDPRFRTWSLGGEAGRLSAPCLLVQGENDEYGTLAQLDAVASVARGPVSRLVVRGAGHSPFRDAESDVVDAIVTFASQQNRPEERSISN